MCVILAHANAVMTQCGRETGYLPDGWRIDGEFIADIHTVVMWAVDPSGTRRDIEELSRSEWMAEPFMRRPS